MCVCAAGRQWRLAPQAVACMVCCSIVGEHSSSCKAFLPAAEADAARKV